MVSLVQKVNSDTLLHKSHKIAHWGLVEKLAIRRRKSCKRMQTQRHGV